MNDQESVALLNRWKQGDEAAADEIFERYVHRLILLARTRLSAKLQRRVQPEDVVQSAYRSFFRHALEDRYNLERSGDLWRLLSAIAVNKILAQAEFHQAKKRAIDLDGSISSASMYGVTPEQVSHEPTPEEAAGLVEEVEAFMRELEPVERTILKLRLQEQSVEEIAETVRRSVSTVRRKLSRMEARLQERLS